MSKQITSTSSVCFIVCDGGPAAHFQAFANNLVSGNSLHINIYASGPALARLKGSDLPNGIQLHSFTIDDISSDEQEQIATQLIDNCLKHGASTVIVDSGNKFDGIFQAVSSKKNLPENTVRFWCYYDNPEVYVPGGYSIKTEETIKKSQYVLFANINLAKADSIIYSSPDKEIDLKNKTVHGIGYYPVTDVERLLRQREIQRENLRADNGWTDVKHLFVYFGGNNTAYFDQAFPAFLSSLSDIDKDLIQDIVFLIHQHPAAKNQNRDGLLLEDCLLKNNHIRAVISTLKSSDQAQIVADAALYYQTSMAPQFALLGLPTMQVGHEVYHDVLVKYDLCYTATNANELAIGLKSMKERNGSSNDIQQRTELIYNAIGYTPDWPKNLRHIIFENK